MKGQQDLVAIGNWQKLELGFVLENEAQFGSAEKFDDHGQACTPLCEVQHNRPFVAQIPNDSSATHSISTYPNSTTKKHAWVSLRGEEHYKEACWTPVDGAKTKPGSDNLVSTRVSSYPPKLRVHPHRLPGPSSRRNHGVLAQTMDHFEQMLRQYVLSRSISSIWTTETIIRNYQIRSQHNTHKSSGGSTAMHGSFRKE